MEYQQLCDNNNVINNVLDYFDTFSPIDVYEPLIHVAIQYKEFPPYLYYQTHIP